MKKSVYKSRGKTPQEAFNGIWDLLQYNDDYCLKKDGDGWMIRVAIVPPTNDEREQFETGRIPRLGQHIQPDQEMIRRFNEAMDDRRKAVDLFVDISPWDEDIKEMLKKKLKRLC